MRLRIPGALTSVLKTASAPKMLPRGRLFRRFRDFFRFFSPCGLAKPERRAILSVTPVFRAALFGNGTVQCDVRDRGFAPRVRDAPRGRASGPAAL